MFFIYFDKEDVYFPLIYELKELHKFSKIQFVGKINIYILLAYIKILSYILNIMLKAIANVVINNCK